jgi:hypothetical protein
VKRRRPAIDFAAYFSAIGLLLRNPAIVLGPLAAAMCTAFITTVLPGQTGGVAAALGGGLWSLIFFLIDCFGLGVALIAADSAWRHGKVVFDDALDQAKARAGGLLMAAVGLNFIMWLALQFGSFLSPALGIAGFLAALFFFIYALPAAAIGGVSGVESLQVSLDRVKTNYAAAALVYVVSASLVAAMLLGLHSVLTYTALGGWPSSVQTIVLAIAEAIVSSYIALILAKTYSDVTFTPPRW